MTQHQEASLSLSEIQAYEFEILKAVSAFCTRHGIAYFLCCGTLLGAVRHGGFVPWDDDIDIFMPRPDYERFKTLRNEFSKACPGYYLRCPGDTHYGHACIKVMDERIETSTLSTYYSQTIDQRSDLWIDIFVLDGIDSDEKKRRRLCTRIERLRSLAYIGTGPFVWSKSIVKTIIKFPYWAMLRFFTALIVAYIDKRCRRISFDTAAELGVIASIYGIKEVIKKDELFPARLVSFNGMDFPAPADWHPYLCRLYGDYMRPPPEEKRIPHHTRAWKK